MDPLVDDYPQISPYAYCHWNPVKYVDPDGMDDEQREAALNLANEYVKMNLGNSYKLGDKGGPGESVDCSGLVSSCIVAGGEKDPNRGSYNGVRNIANKTQKIDDINDIVAGNLVTFNTGTSNGDYSHIGIISDVKRDDDGNVVDFQFIHSGSTTGPTQTGGTSRFSRNNKLSWRDITTGFYKWDTRPDTYIGPVLPQVTALGRKLNVPTSIQTLNVKPISIKNIPIIRR